MPVSSTLWARYGLFRLWPGLPTNARRPVKAAGAAGVTQRYVCDAIVPQQGPNYILAKRLQHWRAMVSACAPYGCNCSASIAPATATASVLSNKAAGQWPRPRLSLTSLSLFCAHRGVLLARSLNPHDAWLYRLSRTPALAL